VRLLVSGSTRTVARCARLWPRHLGHLLVPGNRNRPDSLLATGLPWACDNGAFAGLDVVAFRRMLGRIAGVPGCLWVAVPDVVGDARATLGLFDGWRAEVAAAGHPLALVGQDGAEALALPWGAVGCLFMGGSTRWKLSAAAADLCGEAKRRGLLVHVGRVNSLRRLQAARDMGADSVDGSSASRWGEAHVPRFCRRLAQLCGQPVLF
jgi:hypothetical protein